MLIGAIVLNSEMAELVATHAFTQKDNTVILLEVNYCSTGVSRKGFDFTCA
jgi:hypothetical protein